MRRCRVPRGYTQRLEPPFLRVAATCGDEENARIYAVHLTTANQRQDAQSASCLCGYWGGLGRKWWNRENSPTGSCREVSRLGIFSRSTTFSPTCLLSLSFRLGIFSHSTTFSPIQLALHAKRLPPNSDSLLPYSRHVHAQPLISITTRQRDDLHTHPRAAIPIYEITM